MRSVWGLYSVATGTTEIPDITSNRPNLDKTWGQVQRGAVGRLKIVCFVRPAPMGNTGPKGWFLPRFPQIICLAATFQHRVSNTIHYHLLWIHFLANATKPGKQAWTILRYLKELHLDYFMVETDSCKILSSYYFSRPLLLLFNIVEQNSRTSMKLYPINI